MTKSLRKNSDFEVLSRIINNSCAENSVNPCGVCKSLVRNLTDRN